MAGSAGSRAWPRRPGRRCVVASPSWTSQPIRRGRIRQHDGPKRRRDTDPGLLVALDRLVAPDTRGAPDSPLRWTCKSTRELAEAFTAQGHPVSDDTVGRLLREQGYRLQRTLKTLEGAQHADRDAQFRYLNEQAKVHLADGQPVVSVDTKKKELVGNFANGGQEWQPSGEPERVNVHDFPDPKLGKAIPYGVYACVLTLAPAVRLCDRAARDVTRPPCDPSDNQEQGHEGDDGGRCWKCAPIRAARPP